MKRREFCSLLAAAGTPGALYRDYSRCLPDYLRDLAARAYDIRNRELRKLTNAAAIRQRQAWARETLWKLTGGMPERTPLHARVTGSFERQGYRVEKIVYESQPGFHVPANLYIPGAGAPPFPGVLFQMGHTLNGKAGESYQRCCQALARLGYLVLAFDPMGQGERVYYPGQIPTRTRLSSADDEHTVPGRQMLLVGQTATRMQVWDAVRSLDYLASHPLVDPKRLASTGQSGGGTLTMLLAAVDDRLAAAAVMSGNTENVACADFNPPGSTDDAEQDFVASGPLAFDRWDTLYPFAPKPLLISVSERDFFGTYSSRYLANGLEEFEKLGKVYQVLGARDRLAWYSTPLPHGLSYDTRLQVYNWFARHLRGERGDIREEPPTEPEKDETLWVAPGGSVVRGFQSHTPLSLTRSVPVQRQPAALEKLLGIGAAPGPVRASVLRRVPSFGIDVEAIEVPSVARVWLPAWLFIPRHPPNGKLLLAVESSGRNARWREGDLYQRMAAKGTTVCVADVRGIGDLTPEYSRGAAPYARSHNDDENYGWASLILGQSLAGQRAADILALASALRAHPAGQGRKLKLAASARLTVPALFAAALDRAIDSVYLSAPLVSFANVLAAEEYNVPFGNFVPRLLLHTDLPEIARDLAPRPLCLAGVVGPAGEPVPEPELRRLYSGTHITIRPRAQWDIESLE